MQKMKLNPEWSDEFRAGFEAGYVAAQSDPGTRAGAMIKIMSRLGIVGASHSEIAEQVCKRLDGQQAIIDAVSGRKG
jgi:hypothetical protein